MIPEAAVLEGVELPEAAGVAVAGAVAVETAVPAV
jgi:hypothetical protein